MSMFATARRGRRESSQPHDSTQHTAADTESNDLGGIGAGHEASVVQVYVCMSRVPVCVTRI